MKTTETVEESQKEIVTLFRCQLCGEEFPVYEPYRPVCICDDCKKLWKQMKKNFYRFEDKEAVYG